MAIGLSHPATAQGQGDAQGVDIELFKTPSGSRDLVMTTSPHVAGDLQVGGGLIINYARRPLIRAIEQRDGSIGRTGTVVDDSIGSDVYASIGLLDRMEVGIAVPVGLFQDGDGLPTTDGLQTTGLGDVRLTVKVLIADIKDLGVGIAFAPRVSFPSGDRAAFRGDGFLTLSPALSVGRVGRRYRVSAEVGVLLREEGTVHNIEVGQQLFYRAGLGWQFAREPVELLAEVYGNTTADTLFVDDGDGVPDESPLEALVAARYRLLGDLILTLGASAGVVAGVGAPQYRLFLGTAWAPADGDRDGDGIRDRDDYCPDDPEDRDGWEDSDGCPDTDNDGDGVLDTRDRCPTPASDTPEAMDKVREDQDGWEDSDGCPDTDNDADGILDVNDRCPNEPEDVDTFEDEDGCPDPDNDNDRILDDKDKCPLDPEDYDKFEDEDGCPDPDNDGDGIVDALDKCPDQPEDPDGDRDDDGCPDAPRLVIVRETHLELLEPVHFEFDSDVIKPVSFNLLNQVSATVMRHPEWTMLQIEGHTDSHGTAEYNLSLSQRRAMSVLRYLTDKGISPTRLLARGFGEDRAKDSNESGVGRAANRRVEFHIGQEGQ